MQTQTEQKTSTVETKPVKPSKADLLKELESIRESLVSDGAAMQDAFSATAKQSNTDITEEGIQANKEVAPHSPSQNSSPTSESSAEEPQSSRHHSLMKKSYLEIDESDYDYELKIPAHAKESISSDENQVKDPEVASLDIEQTSATLDEAEPETHAELHLSATPASEPAEPTKVEVAHGQEETPQQRTEPEAIELDETFAQQDAEEIALDETPIDVDATDIAELAQMLSHDEASQSEGVPIAQEEVIPEALPKPDPDHVGLDLDEEEISILDEPVLASEIPTIEVPAIDDALITQQLSGSGDTTVLPGQRSLFGDTAETEAVRATEPTKKSKPTTKKREAAIKQVENPFLPQHIKAKLERERTLYEQEINAAVQTNSARQYSAPTAYAPHETAVLETAPPIESAEEADSTAKLDSQQEQLIDQLVSEYLPKIEALLRERLRDSLAKDNQD